MKADMRVTNFGECEVSLTLQMSWSDLQMLATQLDASTYPSYLVQRAVTGLLDEFQAKTSKYITEESAT